ncbi:hypothetical protein ACJX0J_033447, partial [Zea mays]
SYIQSNQITVWIYDSICGIYIKKFFCHENEDIKALARKWERRNFYLVGLI